MSDEARPFTSRLSRRAINGLCLLSALACAGSACAWWRSIHSDESRLGLCLFGEPIALRSGSGRFVVFALPRADPVRQAGLRQRFARNHNRDLQWSVRVARDIDDPAGSTAQPYPPVGVDARDPAFALTAGAGCLRPLFDALADPDRFALAHLLLGDLRDRQHVSDRASVVYPDRILRQVEVIYRGLRVSLPPNGWNWQGDPFARNGAATYQGAAAGYDPAQIPALRDYWFDQLARPVASSPWWALVTMTALPPLLWLVRRSRRLVVLRRRCRLGLCAACGYDLNGSSTGRCPECGAAAGYPRPRGFGDGG